jgi:outer membrane lipoprotein SlyB
VTVLLSGYSLYGIRCSEVLSLNEKYIETGKLIVNTAVGIGGAMGGAELGATLGMSGGPAGVMIGGIFGAFVGGFFSGSISRHFIETQPLKLEIQFN